MKIKRKILLLASLLFLGACDNGNVEVYEKEMQLGRENLNSENYEHAASYFEDALKNQPNDEEAQVHLEQTKRYREAAAAYTDKNYEQAMNQAQQIDGVEVLVEKANEIITNINAEEKLVFDDLNKTRDLYESGQYDEALADIERLLTSEALNNAYFTELKSEGEQLKEAIQHKKDEIMNAFENLPEPLKALLATTFVDERATSPELLGFHLYYNLDQSHYIVNIHSGAGVGHPTFIIQDDGETIIPKGGYVYMGIDGTEDVPVDSTPISKIECYNRYMDAKESYDLALANVVEITEMTVDQYEAARLYIGE